MTVKTAISLNSSLFEKVESRRRELNLSRNRLFAIAVEEFIERHETERMLAAINEAYDDFLEEEEQAAQRGIHASHRKLNRDELW